jgi:hypothetical protein
MSQNGDVMRSDRLKQVMQEIDNSFDEKNLGISKFSRFCLEASQRGLISVNKLENGQLEVGLPREVAGAAVDADATAIRGDAVAEENGAVDGRPESARRESREAREERGRRGRRGRGRGRDREDRGPRVDGVKPAIAASTEASQQVEEDATATPPHGDKLVHPPAVSAPTSRSIPPAEPAANGIGSSGERLTRQEAFGLVGRAVAALTSGDRAVPASRVREQAFELLGRDSESLSERNFIRILKDAHDGDVIDLRRRGDDYEVAMAVLVAPVADQLSRAAAVAAAATSRPVSAPAVPRGMGPRGAGAGRGRGMAARGGAPPLDLLLLGVVEEAAPPATTITASLAPTTRPADPEVEAPVAIIEETGAPKRGRARKKAVAKKAATKTTRPAAAPAAVAPAAVADVAVAGTPARTTKSRRGRGKKKAATATVDG